MVIGATQTAPALDGQTVRQMVRLAAGGQQIRVRLSNVFGRRPLAIAAASVGMPVQGADGHLDGASLHALRFHGQASATVPPGGTLYSDPVDMSVRAGDVLGVSLYVAGPTAPSTWNPDALRASTISTRGNYTMAATLPRASTTLATLWLSGVDVAASRTTPVVVALGDSITNGFRSDADADHSYPARLAERLRDRQPMCRVAVLNAGIDGNELSADDGGYGPGESMERRFGRDVFAQHGVRYVILLAGINDIGESTMADHRRGRPFDGLAITAHVIAAQRRLIDRAHAAGLRIIGATLTPFEGTLDAYSAQGERARQRINVWIRHRAPFDAVIDFDAALRDPAHPARLRPALDSGDHLHPDDRGYAAMAAAVPPALFGCR